MYIFLPCRAALSDIVGMHPIKEFIMTLKEFLGEVARKGVIDTVFEGSTAFASSLIYASHRSYVDFAATVFFYLICPAQCGWVQGRIAAACN